MSWTLIGGNSADFYLMNITTNAPHIPYEGLLNVTTTSFTMTGFHSGYEYNITVRGVNCGSQEGNESVPLTIRPQGMYTFLCTIAFVWCHVRLQPSSCKVDLSFNL